MKMSSILVYYNQVQKNSSQHFNLPNHSVTDMILQGIESLGTRPDTFGKTV